MAKFDSSIKHRDNFRVHLWLDGRDTGVLSCPISTHEQAEDWICDWKSAGVRFENDDLRIHDVRSAGHVSDCEAA